ncbi:hypothetical protein IKG13_03245 [Candidatus Saccharibacteria bacterium]|nr:hypothetical protein [Candidatus Saccharibacteria bacterium]MBR3377984.1 hypothetical protein [Candidatus Saccharibacteria bacterium]
MDQDGNTAMPQKPDFSSPNSTDADKQQIAAAAASMTESDPKQAITSAPSNNGAPAHDMFGNRRFKAKKDATPTSFVGAPDFFNQAAGGNSQDFVTVSDAPANRSSNKKLFIIGGVLLAALAVVLIISFLPGAIQKNQASSEQKKLYEAWHKMGCRVIHGEDDCEITTSEKSFTGWHIPSDNSDLATAIDAVDNFISFAKKNSNHKDKDFYIDSSQDIKIALKALDYIDSYLEMENGLVINAVVSRDYNDGDMSTIVYSEYSQDAIIASVQRQITDRAISLYKLMDYHYNNGCNTEELLESDDCVNKTPLTDGLKATLSELSKTESVVESRRSTLNNQITNTIYDLDKELKGENE